MSKKTKYELSVIIVSFNTQKILNNCLESLAVSLENIKTEVIVVDNASKDKSVNTAKGFSNKLDIRVIENDQNLGFGKANNQGMNIAKGDLILLLNSDTIVNDSSIKNTVNYMHSNNKVGVISCKLVQEDGSVQSNGGFFPSFINILFWMTFLDDIRSVYKLINPYHINPDFHDEVIREQDWVTGAYFLIRKEIYEQIGGFDEDYFMYVEEMDYCYRIKSNGWQVIYYPNSQIIHLGGASGPSDNAIIKEFEGLKIFYKKHRTNLLSLTISIKLGIFLRRILFFAIGDKKRSNIYEKAWKTI